MDGELRQQTDLLYHAREGTCLEVAPGLWLVRGKTGSYEVNETEGACNCKAFEHHPQRWGCKHLAALREFLTRGEKTCPCCRGEGCQGCDGQGRVSGELHPILLDIQRAEDAARLALVKEIFAE